MSTQYNVVCFFLTVNLLGNTVAFKLVTWFCNNFKHDNFYDDQRICIHQNMLYIILHEVILLAHIFIIYLLATGNTASTQIYYLFTGYW